MGLPHRPIERLKVEQQVEKFLDDNNIRERYRKQFRINLMEVLAYCEDAALQPLKDKRVVMVDDAINMLITHVPALIGCCESGYGIHFDGRGGIEELCGLIQESEPDVVLMDYDFDTGVGGTVYLTELHPVMPNIDFVGFSTQGSFKADFLEAGAIGFLRKDLSEPKGSMFDLAGILAKQEG